MSIAISVENISKRYRLGAIGGRTLAADLNRWWAKLRGKPNPYTKIGGIHHGNPSGEYIWALQDINFQISQGQSVGIIGRNGAGKSTLLKLLSRVTAPTNGLIKMRGRIASLLEVGTGFHPELTGRENIFLNGAILGMRRAEIRRKLDEIIEFSGVEKFIDTPVKRYSSGMYVRLAFAVAAHLDTEILIVDEVLAVGDADFQKKCLGKMDDVSKHGRTVLFVSHNMGMINSLCSRCILLDKGTIILDGDVSTAINRYYGEGSNTPFSVDFSKYAKPIGDEYATLLEGHIEDENGSPSGEIDIRSTFCIKMKYRLNKDIDSEPMPNFHFYNSLGQCAFISSTRQRQVAPMAGIYEATCFVPGYLLNDETYLIGIALTFLHSGVHVSFYEQAALAVIVRDPIEETLDDYRNGYSGPIPGAVRPKLKWEVNRIP